MTRFGCRRSPATRKRRAELQKQPPSRNQKSLENQPPRLFKAIGRGTRIVPPRTYERSGTTIKADDTKTCSSATATWKTFVSQRRWTIGSPRRRTLISPGGEATPGCFVRRVSDFFCFQTLARSKVAGRSAAL